MNFIPNEGLLLVLKDKIEVEEKIGSLYIPESAKESTKIRQDIYTIKAISDNSKYKIDDKIAVDRVTGSSVSIDNIDYLVIREEDLLGRFL